MKIVVVGDGKVGHTLTGLLAQEGHELIIIDTNSQALQALQDTMDIAVVNGNGAAVEVQREAGVPESDLLIAATNGDEVNLLCCMVARKLGCPRTIARVRNPEYDEQIRFLMDDLGLTMVINPEKAAAQEVFRLLQFPSFLKRDSFAQGKVERVEIRLREDNVLAGRRLDQLGDIWKLNALICSVEREGEVAIPGGAFTLRAGDKITVATDTAGRTELIHRLGIDAKQVRHVMIIGGSRIAAYLATRLLKHKIAVTIIEEKPERCMTLSEQVPGALIINANGTQQEVLLEEGIRTTDAVVTLTGMDEENLIISMFANYIGVPKTITKINRSEYGDVFSNVGIDTIVSPKLLTANEIVRYVRALGESGEGSVQTLYRIVNGKAEALEFTVPERGSYLGVPLAKLELRPDILLACILRGESLIIPKGGDYMLAGDSVVIVTKAGRAFSKLTDVFAHMPEPPVGQ